MKREAIINFFQHIARREPSHGVQNAFRFKAVLSSRKKGKLINTHYFDDYEPTAADGPDTAAAVPEDPALAEDTDPAMGGEPDSDPALSGNQFAIPGFIHETTFAQLGTGYGPSEGPSSLSRKSQRSKEKSRADISDETVNHSMLTYDRVNSGYNFDQLIRLDPELEFHPFPTPTSLTENDFPPLPDTTTEATTSRNSLGTDPVQCAIDEIEPDLVAIPTKLPNRRSPRKKTKNAESLAIEEAKIYAPKRKTRR